MRPIALGHQVTLECTPVPLPPHQDFSGPTREGCCSDLANEAGHLRGLWPCGILCTGSLSRAKLAAPSTDVE